MAKHLLLKIEEPCHEDWDKMSDSDKGRFCGSCQKQVIDFSGMTDTQLATFFKKPHSGSMCGRFYSDQLDKKITVPRKQIPWVKYFFQFSLPLFLATLKAGAQKKPVQESVVQSTGNCFKNSANNARIRMGMIIYAPEPEKKIEVKGRVINEEGQPVQFAGIEIQSELRNVFTDSNGVFSFFPIQGQKKTTLTIWGIGYESKEQVVTEDQINNNDEIIIRLKEKSFLEGLVFSDSTGVANDTFYSTIVLGGFSLIELDEHEVPELLPPPPSPLEQVFKIYANPAKANSKVFIDAKLIESGVYNLQLFNYTGQLIRQEVTRIEKGAGAIPFSIPTVRPGNYLIAILDKKTGNRMVEKLIVQ